jgi:hypothetical protein
MCLHRVPDHNWKIPCISANVNFNVHKPSWDGFATPSTFNGSDFHANRRRVSTVRVGIDMSIENGLIYTSQDSIDFTIRCEKQVRIN